MTWLLELALKLCGGNKLIAYSVLALVAAALVATLYATAYSRGYRAADQKALVKQLKEQNETLQTSLDTASTTLKALETSKHEDTKITQDLAAGNTKERIIYRTLHEAAAAQATVPAADGNSAVCIVDARYVGVWNAALEASPVASVPDTAGSSADAVARSGVADAEVSTRDLLDNHIDNRELDSAIRRQCSTLIEWHHQHDR